MLPVEAKPLLAEEHSSSATETAESERSTSARSASPPPTRISIARDWGSSGDGFGQSSYTDLVSLAKEANAAAQGGATSRNQLGAINGVYVPCLLNIIGVILFLRLGWGVGQAGVEGMLLIFFMAEMQAVLTVLSASTIASNGSMQGGGSYFLISRSLGPEFGGAIGLQFYFLYAVGVSMYLVGFAEEAQRTWLPDPGLGKRAVVVIIASAALLVILVIGLIGANAFAKVNKYLFLLQFTCVAIGALLIYVLEPHALKSGGDFTGVRVATLKANLKPDFTSEQNVCGDGVACTLAGVYAIVFPLATGFMEGLNLSGDLKNPGRSIPVGTLSAVGTSCVIYIFLILTFAAAFTGETLRNNFTFFQEVSHFPYVVILGVLVSCFSSGLGALFGASRILQAIARDDLFPLLSTMAQGSHHGDEPQHAVIFTALLTQIFIFLGDLDLIAPICTSFFCLAYAGVNLTCFLLQVTGVPNFRPTFRYHSWHLSLLGVVLNIGVMIYLNALYAVVSLLVLTALFFYLYMTVSPKHWGDISQALMYHQVRKYLLRLDARKAHSKYWRPSVLLLTNDIKSPEVRLCHSLKKGGLYVIGHVVTGEFTFANRTCGETYNKWLGHIFDSKMKAIPLVVAATDGREGYRMLMQSSGLGGMQVNTVVIPWTTPFSKASIVQQQSSLDLRSIEDFVGLLVDAIIIKNNIVVTRHVHRLDPRLLYKKSKALAGELGGPTGTNTDRHRNETIDVWVAGSWDTPGVNSSTALMLQLAYVLHSNRQWYRRTRIRLIKACASSNPIVMHQERLRLGLTATALRVDEFVDEMLVVSINTSSILAAESSNARALSDASSYFDTEQSIIELNQTLQRNSVRTAQVILMLPDPRTHATTVATKTVTAEGTATTEGTPAERYVTKLELLTNNLPSTLLIFSDDEAAPVVSTSI